MIDASRLTTMLRAALLSEDDPKAFKFPGVPGDQQVFRATGEHVPKYFYWLDPAALSPFRGEIIGMLTQLPDEFMDNGGGGWSFLNLCTTKRGELWTGMQGHCEELIALAAALGLADWMMPRDLWEALPGAVPYVSVKRSVFGAKTDA